MFNSPNEDESYTPYSVSLHIRKTSSEIVKVYEGGFAPQCRWLVFPLYGQSATFAYPFHSFFFYGFRKYVWTDMIKFIVHSNYEDGIDCRIREVSIRGPILFVTLVVSNHPFLTHRTVPQHPLSDLSTESSILSQVYRSVDLKMSKSYM